MRLVSGRTFYKEPWYGSYHSMMDRCYRKTAKNYPFYGGRGIEVCPEWHNIENLEKWAMQSGFQKGMSLDRINVNGDYSPDNCKCATPAEQAKMRANRTASTYNNYILENSYVWSGNVPNDIDSELDYLE